MKILLMITLVYQVHIPFTEVAFSSFIVECLFGIWVENYQNNFKKNSDLIRSAKQQNPNIQTKVNVFMKSFVKANYCIGQQCLGKLSSQLDLHYMTTCVTSGVGKDERKL